MDHNMEDQSKSFTGQMAEKFRTVGQSAQEKMGGVSKKAVLAMGAMAITFALACGGESDGNVSPSPTAQPDNTPDATIEVSPTPRVTIETPNVGENTPSPTITATEVLPSSMPEPTATPEPKMLTTPEIADSPEKRMINFHNRVVKDEYKINQLPQLLTTSGIQGSTVSEPVGKVMTINGAHFFPLDLEGPDGNAWAGYVQIGEGISNTNKENAINVYKKYFKSNENSDSEWKEVGNDRFERVIEYPDGSFDSELAYFANVAGVDGKVIFVAVCNIQPESPFNDKTCFDNMISTAH